MDTLSKDFELSEVHDAAERTTTANNVVDLMSALTAGVEAATKGRPGAERTTLKSTTKRHRSPGSDTSRRSRVAGRRTSPVSLPLVPSLV